MVKLCYNRVLISVDVKDNGCTVYHLFRSSDDLTLSHEALTLP
jgi:hypothetical protein